MKLSMGARLWALFLTFAISVMLLPSHASAAVQPPAATGPSAQEAFATPSAPAAATAQDVFGPARESGLLPAAQAPTDFRVERVDDRNLRVSWTPGDSLEQITGYALKLDGRTMTEFRLENGQVATTHVIDDAPFAAGGEVTVEAINGIGVAGAPSEAVTLQPDPDAPAEAAQAAQAQDDQAQGQPQYSTQNFGNGFIRPGYADTNDPTAEEVYGGSNAFQRIPETFGVADRIPAFLNYLAKTGWVFIGMMGIATSTMLAWVLNSSLYDGLTQASVQLLEAFEHSSLRAILLLAVALVLLLWAMHMMRTNPSELIRGSASAFVWSVAATGYLALAAFIVPNAILMPLKGAQFTVAQVNSWQVPGQGTEDYNLSVVPTFNGDPLEQGVRQMLYQDWLNTSYPAYCLLAYGDIGWSTTTLVPNSDDLPEYRDLTFCEYQLKADMENNQTALDKLRSDGGTLGVGGRTGYIEAASPDAWKFYQGQSSDKRIAYVAAMGLVFLIHALFKLVLMGAVVIMVLFLAYDAILLGILLVSGIVPNWREPTLERLRGMFTKTWAACILVGVFVITNKLSVIMFAAGGPKGWFLMMLLRSFVILAIIGYVVYLLWRRHENRGRRQNPQETGSSGSLTDTLPDVVSAATGTARRTPARSGFGRSGGTGNRPAAPRRPEMPPVPSRRPPENPGTARKASVRLLRPPAA